MVCMVVKLFRFCKPCFKSQFVNVNAWVEALLRFSTYISLRCYSYWHRNHGF